jgi:hypothetical protein
MLRLGVLVFVATLVQAAPGSDLRAEERPKGPAATAEERAATPHAQGPATPNASTRQRAASPAARGEQRPQASSVVKVQVQGGGGPSVEPVAGAPPPVEASLDMRPAIANDGPLPPVSGGGAALSSLRALATADGEASLEVGGVRETVRPGSRLGGDTVKAVSPGRVVLERPATARLPAALVIVTFDAAGRGKERVFWSSDPALHAAPEVKQP